VRAARPLFASKLGEPYSLGLRGNLVAAGAGAAELEVERVRHYPGGRWLEVDKRVVELTLSPGALLPSSLTTLSAVERRELKAPVAITAYTVRAKTSADAILGTAGALSVSRISSDR
jgi:hypothetical protein